MQQWAEIWTFLLSDLPGIDVSAHIPWRDLQVEYRPRVERKQNKLPPWR